MKESRVDEIAQRVLGLEGEKTTFEDLGDVPTKHSKPCGKAADSAQATYGGGDSTDDDQGELMFLCLESIWE